MRETGETITLAPCSAACSVCMVRGRVGVPLLHKRARQQGSLPEFLPPDHLLAILLHHRLDALHKAPIRIRRGRHGLVAADMDVRPRCQFGQFSQHVVQEGVRDLLVDTKRAEAHLEPVYSGRAYAVAVQLGIRRQGGIGVARQIDLRDDRDEALGGVGDEVGVLRLGVKAAPSPLTAVLPPTSVSRGQDLISMRHPWSSLRCRCSTFILYCASKSM